MFSINIFKMRNAYDMLFIQFKNKIVAYYLADVLLYVRCESINYKYSDKCQFKNDAMMSKRTYEVALPRSVMCIFYHRCLHSILTT